jgi:hypothetical protein
MCLIFFLVKPWDDMLNLVVLVELSHFWSIANHRTVRVCCMSKFERWVDTKFLFTSHQRRQKLPQTRGSNLFSISDPAH